MILKEHVPWPIHSDYSGKNDRNKPTWAILIPLDYSTDTHTVIFAEKEMQNLSNDKNNNKVKNHTFSEKELDLLSHIKKEDLQYVSDPIFYQWKIGSLICWQRNLLHCSDNFTTNKNDYKIALVAFFCEDD